MTATPGVSGTASSITQVARLAKVTSPTLRHYDEIGLLSPAYIGGNGYRYHEDEQLLRPQQTGSGGSPRPSTAPSRTRTEEKPVNAEELYAGLGRHSEEAECLAAEAEQRRPASAVTAPGRTVPCRRGR